MSEAIFILGLILFLAYLFLALFERTRVPDVLMLILVGIVMGPYVLKLGSAADFGMVGPVMSRVALVVVLLHGGIELQLTALGSALRSTLALSLMTFAVTMAVVAVAGVVWLHLGWLMACTLGAILGGTSSAVVIPLVRSMNLADYPATVLTLESAFTDVLTIVLASSLMNAASAHQASVQAGPLFGAIISSMVMAIIVGVLGGIVWLVALGMGRRPAEFEFATLAFAFLVYGFAEGVGFNGGIGVLAFGLTLSNHAVMGFGRIPMLKRFALGELGHMEHAANRQAQFLLKVFFFIFLGISIPFRDWTTAAGAAGVVVVVYALRHLIVRVTVDRRKLTWEESAALCALIPKGLAAAVLGGQPRLLGLDGAEAIEDFTFMVVLVSIATTAVMMPALRLPGVQALYQRMVPAPAADAVSSPAPSLE